MGSFSRLKLGTFFSWRLSLVYGWWLVILTLFLNAITGVPVFGAVGIWIDALETEKQQIMNHCTKLESYKSLETMTDYPEPVAKLLGQAKRVKIDFIIKKFI